MQVEHIRGFSSFRLPTSWFVDISIPVGALLHLCHCCSNAVPVEWDSDSSGGAEQRVCLGRVVQQVQPRDAKQPGVRGPRWLPRTAIPTSKWKQTYFN
jgi:hypothetical protein